MSSSQGIVEAIEAWFANQSDDTEFVQYDESIQFEVLEPARADVPIIVTTKIHPVAAAIHAGSYADGWGMVGRYGLPDNKMFRALVGLAENRPLLFLGDMDPCDLLVFRWLQLQLGERPIVQLGISDTYLAHLDIELPARFVMKCSPSENATLPLLNDFFPGFHSLVGTNCAKLLESGRKIELEAVVSTLGTPSPILLPARSSFLSDRC